MGESWGRWEHGCVQPPIQNEACHEDIIRHMIFAGFHLRREGGEKGKEVGGGEVVHSIAIDVIPNRGGHLGIERVPPASTVVAAVDGRRRIRIRLFNECTQPSTLDGHCVHLHQKKGIIVPPTPTASQQRFGDPNELEVGSFCCVRAILAVGDVFILERKQLCRNPIHVVKTSVPWIRVAVK